MRITLPALAAAVPLLLCAGCGLGLLGSPPIAYRSVSIGVGDRGVLHERAGLYWSVENAGVRTMSSLEIAFSLYSHAGDPLPAFGRNSFRAVVDASLAPGESASYCTNLDGHVPDGPGITVSRFRVSRVGFRDGGVWVNAGSYVYPGEVTAPAPGVGR